MRNSVAYFICIPFFLLIAFGCGNSKNTQSVNKRGYELLESGVLDGAGEEGFGQEYIAVENMDQLNDVLKRMNSVNEEISSLDIPADKTYFEEKMILFIFDEVRDERGYDLEISKTYSTPDHMHVDVQVIKEVDDAPTVVSQYYKVIEMEKSDKSLIVTFL
ncbi:MAG: hypothetical protein R3277_11545 [Brumimicrobium sp.]|nr:hypothetical protein [Brumimicrobium sp.]